MNLCISINWIYQLWCLLLLHRKKWEMLYLNDLQWNFLCHNPSKMSLGALCWLRTWSTHSVPLKPPLSPTYLPYSPTYLQQPCEVAAWVALDFGGLGRMEWACCRCMKTPWTASGTQTGVSALLVYEFLLRSFSPPLRTGKFVSYLCMACTKWSSRRKSGPPSRFQGCREKLDATVLESGTAHL